MCTAVRAFFHAARRFLCLRHTAYGVPQPELALVAGFALQFAGAVLLLLDVHLLVAAI
ncbi:MAG TPA: hypothetical protein VLF65_11035 [Burkholderiales bacterium]|jgi:hypothetical protein|nr:hypothetical protein [Burkholderiales bacterium]